MHTLRLMAIGFAAVNLSACAAILDGTHQDLAVDSIPPQASCELTRGGEQIASVPSTPANLNVKKTKDDVVVTCKKSGYQTATFTAKSGIDNTIFFNLILGGGIGFIVDSSTGADNEYKSPVIVALPVEGESSRPVSRLDSTETAPARIAAASAVSAPASNAPAPSAAPGQHSPFGVGVAEAAGERGLKVVVVVAGSAAASAGIAAGDVLVSIDGEPVLAKGDIKRIVGARPEGSIVAVRLIHDGATKDVAASIL